jgi:hypothetical protein
MLNLSRYSLFFLLHFSQSHLIQELISFPPIVLPPEIRQALMVPRAENALPESTPNLALRHLPNPPHGSHGIGFNKLKLRVPMERRSALPPVLVSFLTRFLGTMRIQTISLGLLKYKTSTSVSQRSWRQSRPAMILPLPPSHRASSNGNAYATLNTSVSTCKRGSIASTCLASASDSLSANASPTIPPLLILLIFLQTSP